MAVYLTLTGVEHVAGNEIDLNEDSTGNIALLDGWRPKVPNRIMGVMGNRLPYPNLFEPIPLRVFGSSVDAVLGKLHDLAVAVDQANRWKAEENVTAVILNYRPDGSTMTNPAQATVFGSPDSVGEILNLPITFNEMLRAYEANPITLNLERLGVWLGDEESENTSVTSTNPEIETTSTFSDVPDLNSPVDIDVDGFSTSHTADGSDGFLFIADASNKLQLIEGEAEASRTAPGAGTILDQAITAASGGNVIRCVPGALGDYEINYNLSSFNDGVRAVEIVAVLANNSSSISWDVWAELTWSAYNRTSGRHKLIDTSTTDPRILSLGIFTAEESIDGFTIYASPTGTGTSAHALDIDYLIVIARDEGCNVIAFDELNVGNPGVFEVRHNLLSRPRPYARINLVSSVYKYQKASGNLITINSESTITFLIAGVTTGGRWTLTDSSGTKFTFTYTAKRRPAYLVPQ